MESLIKDTVCLQREKKDNHNTCKTSLIEPPKKGKKSPQKNTCYVSQAPTFWMIQTNCPRCWCSSPISESAQHTSGTVETQSQGKTERKLGWVKYWISHISVETSSWMLYHIPIPPQSPSN